MRAGVGRNELSVDLDLIAEAADAPLEQIAKRAKSLMLYFNSRAAQPAAARGIAGDGIQGRSVNLRREIVAGGLDCPPAWGATEFGRACGKNPKRTCPIADAKFH